MSHEEFPVFMPIGEDRLCAVVCVPQDIGSDRGVVLLTGSNYTRTHRNRMWVRTARALADAGVPSIRFDYHGVGDSTGRATFDMEAPFDDDAVAAADFLVRATQVSEVTFLATCFGGRTAMAAAARHPMATAATLFPVPLMARRKVDVSGLRTRIKRSIRGREWGKRLFTIPAFRRMRNSSAVARTKPAQVVSPKFKKDFVDFLSRGDVRFIYGDRSDSLPDLRRLLAEVEPGLNQGQRRRLHVELLTDCAPEGFRTLEDQDVAVKHAVASVIGEHPTKVDAANDALPQAAVSAQLP
jgi:pimeloyl-ACP methyl ester carboxylesterase